MFLYAPLIDFDTVVTTAGPKARFGDLITSLMQSSGKAGWGGAQEQKNTGRKHKTQIQEDRSGRTMRSALCKPFFLEQFIHTLTEQVMYYCKKLFIDTTGT